MDGQSLADIIEGRHELPAAWLKHPIAKKPKVAEAATARIIRSGNAVDFIYAYININSVLRASSTHLV